MNRREAWALIAVTLEAYIVAGIAVVKVIEL